MSWPHIDILSFDASISKTGWSLVRFAPQRNPFVLTYGTLRTEGDETKLNQETMIRRAGVQFVQAIDAILSIAGSTLGGLPIPAPGRVAIETSVPGSFGVASQSGALASVAIQCAAIRLYPGVEIGFHHPNHVKKVAALDGKATKAEVKAKVFEWLGVEFRTNTDVTDAIAVAITDAIDMGEIEDPR